MGNEIFAKRVKALREKSNLTATELACKLGIKKTRVCMWETNGTVPRQDVLLELCKLFDVSIDYLLGNDKTDGNNPKNDKICSIQRLIETMDESDLEKADIILHTIFNKTFGGKNHG